MSAEALRLALAALEDSRPLASEDDFALKVCAHNEAIKACRAALAAADASKSVQKRLETQTGGKA